MDIGAIRTFCMALPSVTESIKWENNLVFSVGDKMFCMVALESPFHYSFKVKEEDFEEVSSITGIQPAAYLARAKWVTVTSEAGLHQAEWQEYLKQSYELVKAKLPKKVKQYWDYNLAGQLNHNDTKAQRLLFFVSLVYFVSS